MTPLPYSPDDERIDPDEPALFRRISAAMRESGARARDGLGPGGRVSHARTLAALKGELSVLSDLPPELAQGAFRPGRVYPVVARLSHLPGEALDDRGVSSPRGLAIKLLGVDGAPSPGHQGGTQDLLLETAPVFNASDPRGFLRAFSTVAAAAPLPQPVKTVVSVAARGVNAAGEKVGLASANLDVLGHPRLHPLAERYYSQAPLRWGDHVAKLAAYPEGGQAALSLDFDRDDPLALAHAASGWIAEHGARFTVRAQLRTDARAMPIEDARVPWPEELSPYRPVAELVFPPQDGLSPARVAAVDALGFSPAHSLALHRPLGGIMRARLALYEELGRERRRIAGQTLAEPRTLDEIVD